MPLSILCLFVSYNTGSFHRETSELKHAAAKLSEGVSNIQSKLQRKLSDSSIIRIIQSKSYWSNISVFSSNDYEILIYQNDSLVFWSQNLVIPGQRSTDSVEVTSFQKFRNGNFLVIEKNLRKSGLGETFHISALVPVKYEYETSNSYLKPHFSQLFDIGNYFLLSKVSQPGYLPVKDFEGKTLFFVGIDKADYSDRASGLALIFFLASLLFFVIFIHYALNILPDQRISWLRPLILGVLFFVLYLLLSDRNILPKGVENWRIFNPELFASQGIASSLGGLMIQLLFLFWS
ncbi:MAG: hypothetical protein H0V65_00040, partial [Chitinophagales bacterium]|nr:hypothetical protein [Chitinophagales bacterium]